MKKDITELFCWIDDFCKAIAKEKKLLENKTRKPTRIAGLTDSEIMTIILMSPCRNFKYFLPIIPSTLSIRIPENANLRKVCRANA